MITRDYIHRMLSMLVKVLQRVLLLRQSHDLPGARKELNGAYRSLLGVNPDFARSFSDIQLIDLLGRDKETGPTTCYVLGLLLKEESELEHLALHHDEAHHLCTKALSLLLTAYLESVSPIELDHEQRIESCMRSLGGVELPAPVLEKLFAYYERTHRYDKAEDVLFELLTTDDKYHAMGVDFYERLLNKADEEIAAGGLTRQEINESLAIIKEGSHR